MKSFRWFIAAVLMLGILAAATAAGFALDYQKIVIAEDTYTYYSNDYLSKNVLDAQDPALVSDAVREDYRKGKEFYNHDLKLGTTHYYGTVKHHVSIVSVNPEPYDTRSWDQILTNLGNPVFEEAATNFDKEYSARYLQMNLTKGKYPYSYEDAPSDLYCPENPEYTKDFKSIVDVTFPYGIRSIASPSYYPIGSKSDPLPLIKAELLSEGSEGYTYRITLPYNEDLYGITITGWLTEPKIPAGKQNVTYVESWIQTPEDGMLQDDLSYDQEVRIDGNEEETKGIVNYAEWRWFEFTGDDYASQMRQRKYWKPLPADTPFTGGKHYFVVYDFMLAPGYHTDTLLTTHADGMADLYYGYVTEDGRIEMIYYVTAEGEPQPPKSEEPGIVVTPNPERPVLTPVPGKEPEKPQDPVVILPPVVKDHPFIDVPKDAYFEKAVGWAFNAEPQITDGNGKDKFLPEQICTRGQVVTFLWRSAGCPEPKTSENPFTDVQKTDYFYSPVLWAVENGITDGTAPDKFSPNNPCKNSHILTFIWRAMGKPEDTGNELWYADPLKWAEKNGLLKGTFEGEYNVNEQCPRRNVVEYLYRHYTMK